MHCLPGARALADPTPFSRRYVASATAVEHAARAASDPALRPKGHGAGCPCCDDDDPSSFPLGDLVQCGPFVKHCVALAQAIGDSDLRIPLDTTLATLPRSQEMMCVTGDPLTCAIGSIKPAGKAFLSVSSRGIVVLLKDALVCFVLGHYGLCRRLCSELALHLPLDRKGRSKDDVAWDLKDLEKAGITPAELEFAVATLGLKVNRTCYRQPSLWTDEFTDERVTQGFLKQQCARYAAMQKRARPAKPQGLMNEAWVAQEACDWPTAAKLFTAAVPLADADGDDVARLTARIDLCGALIFGGGSDGKKQAQVDLGVIRKLQKEVKEGLVPLQAWSMDCFVHGESGSEDVIQVFLTQNRGKHGMAPCRELSSKAPDSGKPATAPGPKAVAKAPAAAAPGWTLETEGMKTYGCRLQVGTAAKWKVGVTQLQPSKVTLNPDQGPLGDLLGMNSGKFDYKKRYEGGVLLSLTQDLSPKEEADGSLRQPGIFWALGEVTASVSDAQYYQEMQRPGSFKCEWPDWRATMTCPFCGTLSGKSSAREPCVLLVQQLNQVVFGKGAGKELGMPTQLRQRLACTACFAQAVRGETLRGVADGGEAHDVPVFPELLAGLRQAAPWAEAERAEDVAQFFGLSGAFAALEEHQMAALAAHGLGRLSKSGAKENRGQPVVSMSLRTCAACGAYGAKACKACGMAHYCSEQCQKADWPSHKAACKKARA